MEPRGSSYFVLPNNCMLSDYRRISCGKLFTDIELYSIYANTDSGTSIEHSHDNMHSHDDEHSHNNMHSHDNMHVHDDTHTHNGSHPHHHENTKAVLNRMSRAIGHMESIKTMIENGRDCTEVLIQIAAVRSAINNVGKIILEDHINHCIVDAVETGDEQALKDLNDAIEKFVK